jgi:hypothetical protein
MCLSIIFCLQHIGIGWKILDEGLALLGLGRSSFHFHHLLFQPFNYSCCAKSEIQPQVCAPAEEFRMYTR